MKIAFILPSNTISGGIFTVMRHAAFLSSKGHEVWLGFTSKYGIERALLPGLEKVRRVYWQELQGQIFDAAVATWWETVEQVVKLQSSHYFYFVQGFEEDFYPAQAKERDLVKATLERKFHYICVSQALAKRLADSGQAAYISPPGIDLSLFNCQPAIERRDRVRVLIEGLANEERKGVRRTLEILAPFEELELVYISPMGRPDYQARIDYFFQSVPYSQMPSLIKSCDFIVKLSHTESFALPVLETFACGGTAVVAAFPGCEEYIKDRENALVVPLDDREKIEQAIITLSKDENLRGRLSEAASQKAKSFPIENSVRSFHQAIENSIKNCRGCRSR